MCQMWWWVVTEFVQRNFEDAVSSCKQLTDYSQRTLCCQELYSKWKMWITHCNASTPPKKISGNVGRAHYPSLFPHRKMYRGLTFIKSDCITSLSAEYLPPLRREVGRTAFWANAWWVSVWHLEKASIDTLQDRQHKLMSMLHTAKPVQLCKLDSYLKDYSYFLSLDHYFCEWW